MNKHTPGPWLTYQDEPDIVANLQPHAAGICRMYYVDASETELNAEVRANARLVAAAPDLLEACRRLLTLNQELCKDVGVSTHYPSAELARVAIVKATGEEL